MCAQHGQSTQSPGKRVPAPLTSRFGKDPALGRSPRTPWELPQADTALFPSQSLGTRLVWVSPPPLVSRPAQPQPQLWLCQTGPNSRATG